MVYSFAVRGNHKLASLYLLSDHMHSHHIGHSHKVCLACEEEHEADYHHAGVRLDKTRQLTRHFR